MTRRISKSHLKDIKTAIVKSHELEQSRPPLDRLDRRLAVQRSDVGVKSLNYHFEISLNGTKLFLFTLLSFLNLI